MEPEKQKTLLKTLFENAMKGQWELVLETYRNNAAVHKVRLTASSDTTLHLAVSGGKLEVVLKMLESLGGEAAEILKLKNKGGNTPLHTAAALGYSFMCHRMASIDPSLIAECNNENETPLFLAALFGHEEAFLCLHFLSAGQPSDTLTRKANGDTLLHAALKAEFYSLAFQIICKYPKLVNVGDKDGSTPLHILATKPNAFRSSCFGLFDRIIYKCITVNKIKEVQQEPAAYLKRFEGTEDPWYRQNYGTCAHFFRMLFGVLFHILPWENIGCSKVICFRKNDVENASKKNNPSQTNNNNHGKVNGDEEEDEKDAPRQRYVLPNYATLIRFLKFLMNLLLILLGLGFQRIKRIRIKKERHTVALQVMKELVEKTSLWTADFDVAFEVSITEEADESETAMAKMIETPILIAARMGVTEMVEEILEKFPVSIQDSDADGKNVLLSAVENRQAHTFLSLIQRKTPLHGSVFRKRDNQGNNALHLASAYGEYRPWLIPGSALQMQWEIKWYKFVKRSISKHFIGHYNDKGQTPKQIFKYTHKSLVKHGSEWLAKTSESCSLVAALIATVAFATSTTIPGGVQEETGKPVLGNEPAFTVFSISSLVALCFSVTSLVFFLAILTSRFEEKDFAYRLPWKLILGLTALFTSIAAILVSFCAGHFFELRDKLKFAAFPIYVVTCLPISFFALAQLPLYFDLLKAIIREVPQRSDK